MILKPKKRPCGICRRWFTPNNRLKERQKTCGDPKCQKKWHKKSCAKWNKKNRHEVKTNYLQKKIDGLLNSEQNRLQNHMNDELPLEKIIKVFKPQHIVIIINIIRYYMQIE